MKGGIKNAGIIGVAAVIGFFIWLVQENRPASTPEAPASSIAAGPAPFGIGVPGDPDARINYERARLVNPATGAIPPNMRARELAFARQLPQKTRPARSAPGRRR